MKQQIEKQFENINAHILFDCPMSRHTSFKVGGNAQCLIIPKDKEAVLTVLKTVKALALPLFVMGNGSNILVGDNGIDGVVLKMGDGLNYIEKSGDTEIVASSGTVLSKLAVFAMNNSLGGLEFAHGIPGSVGGAVYMNAGAYDGQMKDVVESTTYIDDKGEIAILKKELHDFSYRHSFFTNKDFIILETKISLLPSKKEEIEFKIEDFKKRRKDKQPLEYPSAGSVFKRPQGHFAGQLIEECGLKGKKIGGAMVSEKHAGFIINYDNAKANDVLNLIEHIKNEVFKKFNIELECEIKMVGKF